ncbi:MAG: carboxypeptidase regulatory-like domain-containing protein [Planctomycetota bacterium]
MRRLPVLLALVLALLGLALLVGLRRESEHTGEPARTDVAATASTASNALDDPTIEAISQREASADAPSHTDATQEDVLPARHDGTGSVLVRVQPCTHVSPPVSFSGVLVPWSAADPELAARVFRTADDGTSLIASLVPGPFTLTLAMGGHVEGVVQVGESTSAVVDLSAGFAVRGVVVDAHGAPVSDADVWLSGFVDASVAEIVATSASDGTFALPCVLGGGYLVARVRGRAPSPRAWVLGSGRGESQFRLVVGDGGAALGVGIRDAFGAPVESARIAVVDVESNADATTPGGGMPAFARTDARGEATIEGLSRARAAVRVRAAGFAPWTGRVDLSVEATPRLDIVMERGVLVHGVVLDADSELVAGARVVARHVANTWEQHVVTMADGRFDLANLGAGKILLSVASDRAGSAAETLHAAPGDELHHVVRLSRGWKLRGQITDLGNQPLVQWRIEAVSDSLERPWRGETSTLPDGTFTIEEVQADRVTVHVRRGRTQSPRPEHELPLTTWHDVAPGRDVDLRLAPPNAFLELAFEPDGLEHAAAGVRVQQAASGVGVVVGVPASGGTLRIGPVAPGSYRVHVEARDSSVAPIDLGAQTLVDGGTVLLQRVRRPR